MTTAIQFLRSGEAQLRPDPATLADGMPMINTFEGDPGLYFRLRDNSLCKIGPIHVGAEAPNDGALGFPGKHHWRSVVRHHQSWSADFQSLQRS